MHTEYTKALLDIIHDGTPIEAALSGLRTVMTERGHARIYGKVLHNALRILSAHNAYAGAFVTVAAQRDVQAHQTAITAALTQLKAEPSYQVTVDDSLIGGYVVQANNTIIDASYKKALSEIYHRLTQA